MRDHWKDPAVATFFISLLLSLVATLGAVTVGKDAALYLDTAQTFAESGLDAAFRQFNWPWFSALLGVLHQITFIPFEPLGYGVCALFMAGTCALMVKLVTDRLPDAGWWACLIVLAIPAFNDFRGQVLREFGYWFFCALALVMAIRWAEKSSWLKAACVYGSVILAALFRLEALFLVAALVVWQLTEIFRGRSVRQALQLLAFPVLGAAVLGVAYVFWTDATDVHRVEDFLHYINPGAALQSFNELSTQFANSMKYRYSRDEAGQIVFFGIIATLLVEFLKSLGPFCIPFLTRQLGQGLGRAAALFKLFGWAYFFYFLVLMVFYWQLQFVNGRYASMLAWLAVPFVALLTLEFSRRHPRLGKVLAVLGMLVVLANVISLSPKKTHFKEAARWVEANMESSRRIYFQDSRMSFYAGRRVPPHTFQLDELLSGNATGFDAFVVELDPDDPVLTEFIQRESLQIRATFKNRGGEVVTILARPQQGERAR